MKIIYLFFFLFLSSLLFSGCQPQSEHIVQLSSTNQVNANNIKAHIEFLADDMLKGRDTGSEGYQIAANYVIAQFKQLSLKPLGDNESFQQIVPFRRAWLAQDDGSLTIENTEGTFELIHNTDFIMSASTFSKKIDTTASTVFVGYGVISEAFNHDDYQGLDVQGKIVIVLKGRPNHIPSEEGAHLGSTAVKRANAAKHGAIGIITVHTPKREKTRSFEKSLHYAKGPDYSWLKADNTPFGQHENLQASAYLHYQQAQALFVGAQRNINDIFNDDLNNETIQGFSLKSQVTLRKESRHQHIQSPNVIGAIEGSDPQLKHEYVVFSAHLDHIGVDNNDEHEDVINNGAIDNASGVATLLETARLLSMMTIKPKRSILFVVVTAEEKGLLGSSYFANNPTVPLKSMVANVNLDMPLLLYSFADVIAFGSTHSSLGSVVAKASEKVAIELSDDPMPEQALFTRSDHYSFVKQGIPSVFLMTGFKSKDKNVDGGKVFKEFLSTHYHNHSDESSLPINYQAAATFVEVNMMIGLDIANLSERPYWLEGDFFGQMFDKKIK
jgi:Zn-dependent M28 family amino/carboxypeptidase